MNAPVQPLGGPIWTRHFRFLAVVFAVGMVMLLWRFVAGLGATTGMSDGYPFGIWIAIDVVTGTALACGGYFMAILVYILNKGQYHPLVRSAIATSAIGYTIGSFSVFVDVGRFWNLYKVPLFFWNWNFNSILLEVALCIMVYTTVLWVELAPSFFDVWKDSQKTWLRSLARTVQPKLQRALPWIIALGLLLPTMHQSSLGSLMMLAGAKLHPLWQTPMLPLLFLISCITMGFGAVVLESTLSKMFWDTKPETRLLRGLGQAVVPVLGLYVLLRVWDIGLRGQFGTIFNSGGLSLLFLLEMALFIVPMFLLLRRQSTLNPGYLFRAAIIVITGGVLYRISTFLIAFKPGEGWMYFPTVPELLITFGLIAGEVMAYSALVKRFPILRAPSAGKTRSGGVKKALEPVASGRAAAELVAAEPR